MCNRNEKNLASVGTFLREMVPELTLLASQYRFASTPLPPIVRRSFRDVVCPV
jgi:hypothetical protein